MTSFSIFTKNSSPKPDKLSLNDKKLGFVFENRFEKVIQKKRYSKDYQYFGIWLAQNLGDEKNIPLYIRLAKTQSRTLLEGALSYVKDYPNARSRGHLFLWFLKGKLESNSKVQPPYAKASSFAKATEDRMEDRLEDRQFDNSSIKRKRKKKTEVELIGKKYEKLERITDASLIREKIDKYFAQNNLESSEQITNPKEFLYEKLLNTRKFASGLQKDQYFEIYKVDFSFVPSNFVVDIIDERDFSLTKKSYFAGKKRAFASLRKKYLQITAEEIVTDAAKVVMRLLDF